VRTAADDAGIILPLYQKVPKGEAMKFLSIKRSPSVVRTVIKDPYDKVIDDTIVITYGVTVKLKLGKWQWSLKKRGGATRYGSY
jgi:hypothetical protein